MIQMISYKKHISVYRLTPAAIFVLMMTILLIHSPANAAATRQKFFSSPESAVEAMVSALKNNDQKMLTAIFGHGSKDLFSSGDDVVDREDREHFLRSYEENKRLEKMGDKKAIFHVGNKDWPFPIPIVKRGRSWFFHTKEGKEEIINRRIGKDELNVLRVCMAYVDAQREYALKDRDGDKILEYAGKFVSDPGKKDGLYWETKEGEELSPLGPFVAAAREEGYATKEPYSKPIPYHGYYYKILTAQGKNAAGGAYDYIVNGKMVGGFALVAYPARYGSSGIMTFVVNQDSVVYERNLGKSTEEIAQAMKIFDPDKEWKKVE
ncbi:MAG: DUF2950 domain-containing protein [Proteobacteria bacterium]|nr:DUF2950 domain-containing protein [Pseudomonadota bacterium]